MLKKMLVVLLLVTVVAAGCTPDIQPPQGEEGIENKIEYGAEEETAGGSQDTTPSGEERDKLPQQEGNNKEEVQQQAGNNSENTETDPGSVQQSSDQTKTGPLLSQEETALMFINAWKQKDLEKMDMLTLQPLKEFFFNSDIFFASYDYLKGEDLAGFIRDGIETLEVYDPYAFENVQIVSKGESGDRLRARLGNAFEVYFEFVSGGDMWKIRMLDSWPVQTQGKVPDDWITLNKTIIKQVKDVDGDNFAELLTMGYWGDWEGMGPEPSSALGIYTFDGEKFIPLFFKGIEDRLSEDRVLIPQGCMGHITGDNSFELLLVEKDAAELAQPDGKPQAEYFLTLYTLEGGKLAKTEEIDWKALLKGEMEQVQEDGNRVIEPRWIEIGGVSRLKDEARESIIIKAGLYTKGEDQEFTFDSEGIFVLSRDNGEWQVDWKHIGNRQESHEVITCQFPFEGNSSRLYYQDIFEGGEKGGLYQVYYDGQEWVETPVLNGWDIKSIADVDQDGMDEFLVWDGDRLRIISSEGQELWKTERLKGTREIRFAWMGSYQGEQWVVAALHRGARVYWKSQVVQWKGGGYNIQPFWNSEELGTMGITAMVVRDIDNDQQPEILVNFHNDYLTPGEYFKIY